MELELLKNNSDLLKNELAILGFPVSFLEEFEDLILQQVGGDFDLNFKCSVGQTAVTGRVVFVAGDRTGMYYISYYTLSHVKPRRGCVRKMIISGCPWRTFRLVEALNLMEGRFVYRRQEMGLMGHGYWIYLVPVRNSWELKYIRSEFEVSNFLAETGLGGWLGLEGWVKLVSELESGCVCDLTVGSGKGMRVVKVEAEPFERRLKVRDEKGNLTQVMS